MDSPSVYWPEHRGIATCVQAILLLCRLFLFPLTSLTNTVDSFLMHIVICRVTAVICRVTYLMVGLRLCLHPDRVFLEFLKAASLFCVSLPSVGAQEKSVELNSFE